MVSIISQPWLQGGSMMRLLLMSIQDTQLLCVIEAWTGRSRWDQGRERLSSQVDERGCGKCTCIGYIYTHTHSSVTIDCDVLMMSDKLNLHRRKFIYIWLWSEYIQKIMNRRSSSSSSSEAASIHLQMWTHGRRRLDDHSPHSYMFPSSRSPGGWDFQLHLIAI
jgi:hypothetical protein